MIEKFFIQLSQDFTQLLESGYDYNVVIEVGKYPNYQIFKAHSVILYQRSFYFRQQLENAAEEKKDGVIRIKLPNVTVKTFSIIIKYIYGGVISLEDLEARAIFDLLIVVSEFMLLELIDHFQSLLINNNESWLRSNFSFVYQTSFQSKNLKVLQQFCNEILVKQPSLIFNSDDFDSLQESALIALLKHDDLQMDESEIWDKVIMWGKARTPNLPYKLEQWTDENFESLEATLQYCLPYIRYFQISGEDIIKKVKPYQNILEKNLWEDIMLKFVAPNMPITSPVLPPRKEALIQNVPIITLSSTIITLQHVAEISSWIDHCSSIYDIAEIPYNFKLLLRGSRDGFSGEVFHKLCDNVPGTVIVLKVKDTDEIIGGYNPLIWKIGNNDENAITSNSFIFSLKNGKLKNSIISRVCDTSRAISYSSTGPWFSSNDLGMGNSYVTYLKKWHCEKDAYKKSIRSISGWFSIDDYEVFKVCKLNSFTEGQCIY